jgi:DNA-binding HxlR family transcriptional regulator
MQYLAGPATDHGSGLMDLPPQHSGDRGRDSHRAQQRGRGEQPPNRRSRQRQDPIADALDIIGERWTPLVLCELSSGVTRFEEIRVNTGAPRSTLSLRLRKLEEYRLIERRRYREHPPRDEYALTPARQDLRAVLRSLRQWDERYATHDRS